MATMKEIARLAGVSQATVSRVINGVDNVHPEIRERVMKSVRELDYQPNANARSLKQRRSNLLGVILPGISNPFFPDVVHAVLDESNRHGRSVLLFESNGNAYAEWRCIQRLYAHRVEGVLLVPVDPDAPHLKRLKSMDIPAVVMTQEVSGFPSVSIDHREGGRLVAKHFLDLGHVDVAFLGASRDPKLEGFRAALFDAGISFGDERIIECRSWQEEATYEAYLRTKEFFGANCPHVSALFAYNDLAAIGAMRALEELGVSVPDDVALVGFDNTPLSAVSRPALTTVAQPTREIGRIATDLLLEWIEGDEPDQGSVTLVPRLVVRESSTSTTVRTGGVIGE